MQGYLAFEEGNLEEAGTLLEQALELDPAASYIHYILALIETQKGELEAAVAEAEKALDGDPGLIEAHRLLGEIFLSAKKPDKAIFHFKKVIEADPADEETFLKLGVAYVQSGELSQATRTFKDLLERNPNSLAAMLALGRLYRQAGLLSKAENHYREILERKADFFPGFSGTGAKFSRGSSSRARPLELYRQALGVAPEKLAMRFRIARLLIHENRLDEALQEYQTILSYEPGNAEALEKNGSAAVGKAQLAGSGGFLQEGSRKSPRPRSGSLLPWTGP